MPDTQNPPVSPVRTLALDDLPSGFGPSAVAVGNFDGVHRGHAALIQTAIAEARRQDARAIVLTFEPHPRTFFRPERPVFRMTPPAAKARIMAALGIDAMVAARFDAGFSQLEPTAFEEDVLAGRLAARRVIVGDGFRFGKGRAGTIEQLKAAGQRFGFDVVVVDPVFDERGERISSSAIREYLAAGDVTNANRLLGYRWFVVGTVIHGEERGRELGFPTANIALPADCELRHGIYAVTLTSRGGEPLAGVASYGRRPQFDNGAPLLEVFVFDFDGDLYDQDVVVTFVDWIRPEATFESVAALVETMRNDARTARSIIAKAGPGGPIDMRLAAVG
ncbi:MAG: bifunctional riboflavin kinase/FAD synthetase [Bauldia sp.]|uniref:bifunctional riboflavin kinase/FAD synthetase n=1 Tax=Bauldia sp. TaxID=2575872 RepID=UPI001DF56123|nr:bifunctional riboflavin kinase/FAD synthetase [Bauldia sp.]MCB1497776.1 bifunctional riboflavin kinase/FAD synthetase [Bauldia sp.]